VYEDGSEIDWVSIIEKALNISLDIVHDVRVLLVMNGAVQSRKNYKANHIYFFPIYSCVAHLKFGGI